MSYVLQAINSIWAIQRRQLETIISVYRRAISGGDVDFEAIKAEFDTDLENKPQGVQMLGSTAIIPIQGVIAKKMNLFSQISGGASTQLIERDFLQALADPKVNRIILDIDSPGGNVDGVETLVNTIKNARGGKEIIAFIDGLGASAAFWIASAADKIFVSESTTFAGSIGVFQVHIDQSKFLEANGEKHTIIRAGKLKAFPDSTEPLTDSGAELLQNEVNKIFRIFVESVARNRGLSVDTITGLESRILLADEAASVGLIDGVITFQNLINMEAQMKTVEFVETDSGAQASADEKYQAMAEKIEQLEAQAAENRKKLKISHAHQALDNLVSDGKLTPGERSFLDEQSSIQVVNGALTIPFDTFAAMVDQRPVNGIFETVSAPVPKKKTEEEHLAQIAKDNNLDLGTSKGFQKATSILLKKRGDE